MSAELIATNTGGDFQIAPEGTHLAICYAVAFVGHLKSSYTDGWPKNGSVRFAFELCNEKAIFDQNKGEEPFGLWTWPYTKSITPGAKLNPFLSSWRNKVFTDEEIKAGFDLNKVLGQPCQLSIVHKEEKSGKTYANIQSIMAPLKGIDIPPIHNIPFIFTIADTSDEMKQLFYRIPKWIRKEIRASKEYIENNINWPELDDKKTSNTPPPPANDPASSQPNSWDVGSQKKDDLPF